MRRPSCRIVLLALFLASFAAHAHAAPVTISFSWEVTALSADYGLLTAGHTVNVGDVFSGAYTFDTDAPMVGGGASAQYTSLGAPYGLVVWGPGWTLSSTASLAIGVYDVPGADHIYVTASHPALPGVTSGLMEILFQSPLDVFSGSALPLTPPSLADFSTARLTIEGVSTSTHDGVAIVGRLTSTEAPAAVPEPATLTLLGTGLAAFVVRRRSRNCRG